MSDDLEALKQDLLDLLEEQQSFVEANKLVYKETASKHTIGFADGMKDARGLTKDLVIEHFGEDALEETRDPDEVAELVEEALDVDGMEMEDLDGQ